MTSQIGRPTFQDPELQREIMQLRQVDNHTNLLYLAMEYLSLLLVVGGAVVFAEYRAGIGAGVVLECPGLRRRDDLDRGDPASAGGARA